MNLSSHWIQVKIQGKKTMYFYTLAKEKLEQNAQNIISNMIKK